MNQLISLQTIQLEMNKKQPILSALGEIVNQLNKMSEEGDTDETDATLKQLGDQITELSDNITRRKAFLQVLSSIRVIQNQNSQSRLALNDLRSSAADVYLYYLRNKWKS